MRGAAHAAKRGLFGRASRGLSAFSLRAPQAAHHHTREGGAYVIGPAGIQLRLQLAVDNPNHIDLSARSVTGKVVLDGDPTSER